MPEETGEISIPGMRKAAILLLALGHDLGASVMRYLDRQQIEDVTREVAELEGFKGSEQTQVLDELKIQE